MKKIMVINTGGTFSKYPNNTFDALNVDNVRLSSDLKEKINISNENDLVFKNIINKDSLEMVEFDRENILEVIIDGFNIDKIKKFIIIHDTDTIDKTAVFLNHFLKEFNYFSKVQIVLVGSMIPFSLGEAEPSFSFRSSYGFLQNNKKNGIFISMNGLIKKYNKIKKNREKLIFEEI